MQRTRDNFEKIRDTKGTFQAKIGTIKDRNGMNLTDAEVITFSCRALAAPVASGHQ